MTKKFLIKDGTLCAISGGDGMSFSSSYEGFPEKWDGNVSLRYSKSSDLEGLTSIIGGFLDLSHSLISTLKTSKPILLSGHLIINQCVNLKTLEGISSAFERIDGAIVISSYSRYAPLPTGFSDIFLMTDPPKIDLVAALEAGVREVFQQINEIPNSRSKIFEVQEILINANLDYLL